MDAIVKAPPPETLVSYNNNLFAAIDMGTNSFKLLIVRALPGGIFFPVRRLKHAVVLGRDAGHPAISAQSQARALDSLRSFSEILRSYDVAHAHTRCFATSAVREAENRDELLVGAKEALGLGYNIDVLSGEEEAALAYKGVIQFLPVFDKLVLNVDIGGGSTEFTVGKQGKVLYCASLRLGHVSLTQDFVNCNELFNMKEKIRLVIEKSGLIENVQDYGFDVAVGSSGTIRALEKAAFHGYPGNLTASSTEREWKLRKSQLMNIIEELCSGGEEEKVSRDQLFGRRSEFIVAGAVLLGEIFQLLGIEEMQVSKYAIAEAAIADTVCKVYGSFGVSANARWQSVVRLSIRLNSKKRIRAAAQCATISKEIFEGIRKYSELKMDEKDLEYLEAACLLHNIGLFNGTNGYHKQSYHMIMNSDQLHGYEFEEIKFIALLAKHHRKKFPKPNHTSLQGLPEELKSQFQYLCAIIRVAFALQQHLSDNFHHFHFSHTNEGYKLLCSDVKDDNLLSQMLHPSEHPDMKIAKELANFREVFSKELFVELLCRASGP